MTVATKNPLELPQPTKNPLELPQPIITVRYPLELPQPIITARYCRCGRRLGAQDPGEQCSTCVWMKL
jgi:hypothetical protein